LQREHVGEVVEFLLEGHLEQAGVAGAGEPGEEVFGVIAEEDVVPEGD
jgi:hypothetical protein